MEEGEKEVKGMGKFEYADLPLERIIRFYIKGALKKHDWEILAVDTKRDVVILRRFEEVEKDV